MSIHHRHGQTLTVEPQHCRVGVALQSGEAVNALVRRLAQPVTQTSGGGDDGGETARSRRARKRARTSGESSRSGAVVVGRVIAGARRALLDGTASLDVARGALLQCWALGDGERASAALYARLFDAAAAASALARHHAVSHNTMVGWLDAAQRRGRWPRNESRARLARNVSFLVARLARRGALDEQPGHAHHWSLERAVREGVVVPPPLRYLRDEMSTAVFDAALTALRAEWRRLAAASGARRH